jgi:hypothetical protein
MGTERNPPPPIAFRGGMTRTKTSLAGALALAALLPAGPAHAQSKLDVRVGIGDQNIQMFSDPNFRDLDLRQVRYFVQYNAIHERDARLKMRAWVKAARAQGMRPLIHISTDDLREKRARLPSRSHYRKDVGRLVRYLRKLGVRDFGTWNEANHKTQPTWDNPRRAAQFFHEMYTAVRKTCKSSCRVLALDVLDQPGVERYVRTFYRALGPTNRRRARFVGIHNYSGINARSTRRMREEILYVAGDYTRRPRFWLTETGGVVKFGSNYPCNERRAANRLDFLFDSTRRLRRYFDRVYVYNWYGGDCDVRFDAGLVSRDSVPRPGLGVVQRAFRSFKR